jgi:hypothetical protein
MINDWRKPISPQRRAERRAYAERLRALRSLGLCGERGGLSINLICKLSFPNFNKRGLCELKPIAINHLG